jgi:DMSO reductase anchor subunit
MCVHALNEAVIDEFCDDNDKIYSAAACLPSLLIVSNKSLLVKLVVVADAIAIIKTQVMVVVYSVKK